MYCTNCGKQTDEKKRHCEHCGFDLIHVQALFDSDDLDDENIEEEFRTAAECAKRCVVLYGVVAVAHGDDLSLVVRWLEEQKLWGEVSLEEKAFLNCESPTEKQITNSTWRIEALYLLLWSLSRVKNASNLSALCNAVEVQAESRFYLKDVQEFINSARLIDESAVYGLNEEIYQAHWKIRDAQIRGQSLPGDLNPRVVQERHHAINWLMGNCGQEWDDVTTDT